MGIRLLLLDSRLGRALAHKAYHRHKALDVQGRLLGMRIVTTFLSWCVKQVTYRKDLE